MNNSDKLRAFFDSGFPLNKEGLEELLTLFKSQNHKKNILLLEAGQTENKLKFLTNGVVREFYTTEEKEMNINFCLEAEFITDFSSFVRNAKSKKHQQCLTDVEILVIEKSVILKFLEKYECGKSILDKNFQKLLERKETFEYNRITKSPEELYQDILKYKPNWILNIPQYHIASYLGITPETLSRIRSRIS